MCSPPVTDTAPPEIRSESSHTWKPEYLEIYTDLEVQIPFVPGIGGHCELANDLLPLLASHILTEVESSLVIT